MGKARKSLLLMFGMVKHQSCNSRSHLPLPQIRIMTTKQQHTLLYIEDNEASRQLIKLVLGHRPNIIALFAHDGSSGIEVAKSQLPDLVLTDINLPDINGYDILSELKSTPATADIPIIALSGDLPSETQTDNHFQFDKYLSKPINLTSLFDMLDEFLDT